MIAIIYESDEWSNRYLRDALAGKGIPVIYIDFETEMAEPGINNEKYSQVKLVVNRLFPSAYCRGHLRTLADSRYYLVRLNAMGVPMINPYESYLYDFSKMFTGQKLKEIGIDCPRIYTCCTNVAANLSLLRKKLIYPCIIKPDCGGRTAYTYILRDEGDLEAIAGELPDIEFITQEYILPAENCIHRVEIFGTDGGGENITILRRSIDAEGLSAYSRGSTYIKENAIDLQAAGICQRIMQAFKLKMASFDLIKKQDGSFCVIDVNATANYAPSDIETFGFNPLDKMAATIIREYELGALQQQYQERELMENG